MTLDSLHLPGNATHGFMDFMLMMGVAGDGVKADYVDSLDLFHTMEAYFTWYPEGALRMSKYLLDKFLYTVDRDPDLVERYREDPAGTVAWWEAEMANPILNCHTGERSTWLGLHRRGTARAGRAGPRRALRDGRPPVPHPDAVHRDVRARPRAAGVPDRLRQGDGAPVAALPRHRHVRAAVLHVTAAPVVPLDLVCASGTSYFGVPRTPRPGDGSLAEL